MSMPQFSEILSCIDVRMGQALRESLLMSVGGERRVADMIVLILSQAEAPSVFIVQPPAVYSTPTGLPMPSTLYIKQVIIHCIELISSDTRLSYDHSTQFLRIIEFAAAGTKHYEFFIPFVQLRGAYNYYGGQPFVSFAWRAKMLQYFLEDPIVVSLNLSRDCQ
jgi:hypothetical protein